MDVFARGGLSLDRLRAFLAIAEAGGIARAAPGDPVRQSQLSRQLGELEDWVGHPLVVRRGRGIALTAAGEELAVVVRELVIGLRTVAARGGPPTAVLGAGDSLLHGWVISRLPLVTGVTITLASMHGQEAIARLLDARLDLGIVLAAEVPRTLRSRPLGAIGFALYVPRALVPRRGLPATDLAAQLPLATQYGDPELAAAVARFAPRPALVCETFPQAQRAVATGHYAAVLPTLARRELPASRFAELALPGIPHRKLALAWHRRLERHAELAAALPRFVAALGISPTAAARDL